MRFSRLFPAFCLALLCWSCTPSSWYAPAFKPQPGAVYHYTVSEVTHASTVENGQRVMRDQNVRLAFHYQLASQEKLMVGFDAFTFHEKGEKHQKDVDLAPDCKDLSCFLTPDGRVSALTGVSNHEYAARLMEKGWNHFPKGNLQVGDFWTALDSLNADPNIPVETTYTLVKALDGVLFIQTNANVHLDGENLKGTSHPGMLSLHGRQHGMLHVDAATGLLLDGQTVLQADGTLKTGGGKIPLHIDSTCSVNSAV